MCVCVCVCVFASVRACVCVVVFHLLQMTWGRIIIEPQRQEWYIRAGREKYQISLRICSVRSESSLGVSNVYPKQVFSWRNKKKTLC